MKGNVLAKFLIISVFIGGLAFPVQAAPKTPVRKVPAAKKTPKSTLPTGKDRFRYTGYEAKRNPFLPPKKLVKMIERANQPITHEKPKKLPKIDFQGLIWSPRMPQVIINGKVMKVGDYIGEWEIKEIDQDGIVLFLKGKRYKLKPPQ